MKFRVYIVTAFVAVLSFQPLLATSNLYILGVGAKMKTSGLQDVEISDYEQPFTTGEGRISLPLSFKGVDGMGVGIALGYEFIHSSGIGWGLQGEFMPPSANNFRMINAALHVNYAILKTETFHVGPYARVGYSWASKSIGTAQISAGYTDPVQLSALSRYSRGENINDGDEMSLYTNAPYFQGGIFSRIFLTKAVNLLINVGYHYVNYAPLKISSSYKTGTTTTTSSSGSSTSDNFSSIAIPTTDNAVVNPGTNTPANFSSSLDVLSLYVSFGVGYAWGRTPPDTAPDKKPTSQSSRMLRY